MKEVKFIKSRTVIIIASLVVVFFIYAVLSYFEQNYQKEYEEIPELSVYYKDKKIAELIPLTYKWSYKGEIKEVPQFEVETKKQGEFTISNPYKQYGEYDYEDENTILMSSMTNNNYVMKMDERHKITSHTFIFDALSNLGTLRANHSYGGGQEFDESKRFLKGYPLNENYHIDVGEYVYIKTINYLKQGTVDYCAKVVVYDEYDAKIAKNYRNISLEDVDKIEELARKIKFDTLLNSVRVEGKNLILEYDWHIQKDNLRMNNLIWFACIPDLETVIYVPKHKKTSLYSGETGELVKEEIEQVVYTREDVDSESLANIENLCKFMEQI